MYLFPQDSTGYGVLWTLIFNAVRGHRTSVNFLISTLHLIFGLPQPLWIYHGLFHLLASSLYALDLTAHDARTQIQIPRALCVCPLSSNALVIHNHVNWHLYYCLCSACDLWASSTAGLVFVSPWVYFLLTASRLMASHFIIAKMKDFSTILVGLAHYSVCLSVCLSLCLSIAYRSHF